MSTGAGIDYSVWDHIYVSDDEDVTSPFVDTPSLFRMRHRSRLERMIDFQQRGEELEDHFAECKRFLEEAQGRLRELEEGRKEGEEDEEKEAELEKIQAEVRKLKKDKKSFEKMIEEYRREEKNLPWNVDTISKEGFSKSVLNVKPVTKEDTREEKVEKHKAFVEKYAKEIRHFGMMRRWDDSQKYLSDNPHLVCDETANCLVVICIDFEIDEKHGLMEQVAHQAIVMQSILDLARTLKVDPRGCFRQFFSKIKTADKSYQDAFDRELELLKERIRTCAQLRMENAMKELEEEEKQKRLGPGGLDPVEVYESLPKEMQRSFDEKNIQMLHDIINKMDIEEGKYHLKRCIDSGLWVPDSGEGDDEEENYEEDEEED
ncbi:hsp90 co-chaperone Cdc37-like [Scomber japonicus]|uniref:hsp90 co-chaperone Cdc37-like n=1 Tax=Scomber japonicus TaxID=13676 RepID=UPI002306BDB8|nr:hsp90 co-chaperone Cdc37-like [Scomber japonicus]